METRNNFKVFSLTWKGKKHFVKSVNFIKTKNFISHWNEQTEIMCDEIRWDRPEILFKRWGWHGVLKKSIRVLLIQNFIVLILLYHLFVFFSHLYVWFYLILSFCDDTHCLIERKKNVGKSFSLTSYFTFFTTSHYNYIGDNSNFLIFIFEKFVVWWSYPE
jgi:hypothetical protein